MDVIVGWMGGLGNATGLYWIVGLENEEGGPTGIGLVYIGRGFKKDGFGLVTKNGFGFFGGPAGTWLFSEGWYPLFGFGGRGFGLCDVPIGTHSP